MHTLLVHGFEINWLQYRPVEKKLFSRMRLKTSFRMARIKYRFLKTTTYEYHNTVRFGLVPIEHDFS